MPDEDKLEVAGKVWDSLSTGRKWAVLGMFLASLAAAFWVGYGFSDMRATQEIAELRAEHAQERADFKNQQSRTQTEGTEGGISAWLPGDDLPEYSEAKTNDLSMLEMRDLYTQFEEQTRTQTSIQKPSFFDKYKGQRFTWSGYVVDVYQRIYGPAPHYSVSFCPKLDEPHDFRKSATFVGEAYEEMAKGLTPNQQIVVSGVMNATGELTQCKFVKIGDTINESSK